jgi:septum formation protein
MRLILASASPRRAELLTAAGYVFAIRAADIDESVRVGESAEAYVRRLGLEKSAAVAGLEEAEAGKWPEPRQTETDSLVLAADTAVVVDGMILGKPADDREAAEMLKRLSGRAHEVLTGVSLRRRDRESGRVERTRVWMAPLSPDEVVWYVASGDGRDKAGGYAIQGLASRFIERIDGSYSNVVGLPVALVHELIKEAAGEAFPALHQASSRTILNASRPRKSL